MRGLQLFKYKREVLKAKASLKKASFESNAFMEAVDVLDTALAVLDHYRYPEKWIGHFDITTDIEEDLPF